MKQLFTRDPNKKKKEKERAMIPEENLRARYTEYKGSRENIDSKGIRKDVHDIKSVSGVLKLYYLLRALVK